MLTSSLGGSSSVNGVRQPSVLIRENGLLDNLKSLWIEYARVLILCGDPGDWEKNDSVQACLRESLPMSGLSVSRVELCDGRDLSAVENLENVDVFILLNDGSYLVIDEGKTTLYGEAYLIKNREIRQICEHGGCVSL